MAERLRYIEICGPGDADVGSWVRASSDRLAIQRSGLFIGLGVDQLAMALIRDRKRNDGFRPRVR